MRDREKRPVLVVPEPPTELDRQLLPARKPALVGGRFVEREAAVGQRRVILEEGGHGGAPAGVNAQQAALGVAQLAENPLGGALRGGDKARLFEQRPRPRQRVDRQPVPGRDHLGVGGRRDALGALREQRRAAAFERVAQRLRLDVQPAGDGLRVVGDVENRLPLKVSTDIHTPVAAGDLRVVRRQQREQLLAGPDEILALDPLGVRVGRGVKRPVGRLQTVQQVFAGFGGDAAKELVPRRAPAVEVERNQQRVVVEHLLEMRHEPDLVHGVAVKAPGQLVVNAALRHPAQRQREMLARARRVGRLRIERLTQDQLQVGRLRKLGRAAETAMLLIAVLQQLRGRAAANRGGGLARLFRGQLDAQIEVLRELVGLLLDLLALLAPGPRHAPQHIRPARHPRATLRRKVRAAEKRPTIGRAENVQRPPAVTVNQLNRLHIDVVHIRPLLAINLDAHDQLILQRRDLLVLERLPLHHMAPVAGRVADRNQHRLLLRPRPRPRLLAPGLPVNRVPRMLQQIRRSLPRQSVGVLGGHKCSVAGPA